MKSTHAQRLITLLHGQQILRKVTGKDHSLVVANENGLNHLMTGQDFIEKLKMVLWAYRGARKAETDHACEWGA